MRSRRLLASISALLLTAPFAAAQYTITTVAGGGPNNLPAAQASIGFTGSIAFDATGTILYIADPYSSQVFKVASGTLTVAAGNGTLGYSGDGGPAASATLSNPQGVFVDGNGNLFIADTGNSVIREVTASNGNIQTVAGGGTGCTGQTDSLGDGCPAANAILSNATGVYVDANGNLFIADWGNSLIREVLAGTGNIQIVAGGGTGCTGEADTIGDGCAATSAKLNQPNGVFVDAVGNVFIADTGNSVIREVVAATGVIQSVAGAPYSWTGICKFSGDGGPAASAQLCLPTGVFVDSLGNVFIADSLNSVIRVVNTSAQAETIASVAVPAGDIQTIAGTPDTIGYAGNNGAATAALLRYPSGVALGAAGNIFIADTNNYVVREVAASTGTITAYAGNHTLAFSGDGGPATGAELNHPGSIFVDASGTVFIADTDNAVIRVYNPGSQPVTVAGITIPAGDIQTVVGTGVECAVPAPGGCGDGLPPLSAQLNFPSAVFVDGNGNIYIADTGLPLSESSAVRVVNTTASSITVAGVSVAANTIQTVAGTLGTAGFAGDGGAPNSAQLNNPQGLFVDGLGDIFIADTDNSALRVATGATPLTVGGVTIPANTIQTLAGTPPNACPDPSTGCGDHAAASAAALDFPIGVALDSAGNVYLADSQNHAIRVVNPSAQPVTIAGTSIPSGDILTVAGTLGRPGYSGDNGSPASANLNAPSGVSLDALGNIFIADSENAAIRQVVAVDSTIQTIAGTGTSGFTGDGGSSTSAELNAPSSVAMGSSGTFVADTTNSRIRKLTSNVTVAVQPSSTILATGGTQQFVALVSGTNNVNVAWRVNGATGGNSTFGTIDTNGLYTAPATAPASAITVMAISDADGTTTGSAQVTIAAAGAPAISITTNPPDVTVVYTATAQAFAAAVTGETNTAVTWEVNTVAGGNSTVGTIDSNGNYTAPAAVPSPALVTITAVSQADATVSGSYPITIATLPAASQPSPQTVSPGSTASFSMSLNASSGDPHHALTLSCLQSTLPPGASCTFTPATITPGSAAVSFSLAVQVPAAAASLRNHTSDSLNARIFFNLSPLAAIVLLACSRRRQRRSSLVLLLLGVMLLMTLVACGGSGGSGTKQNPVTYNIQVMGKTAVQPNPVPLTVVKLTVQ